MMFKRSKKKKRGTRQSTINKRRKGVLAVVLPWLRRFGMVAAVCTGILWAGSWLYLSGAAGRAGDWTRDKILTASADMGFAVDDILVEGREYTDPHVLLAIVNIQKGDPLFAFNPRQAQELISQISWVDDVQIERRWPGTIYIGLAERQPLALWQSDKRLKLLDQKGKVIVTSDLQRFAGLVLVMGKNAPAAAPELIGNLKAEEHIYSRVETAKWIGARRWDMKLKNGIEIKLPEQDAGLALRRLAEAHENDGLLDKDIVSIDMREPGRITVRTKPGTVQDYKTGLKIDAVTKTKAGNNI